MKNPKVLVACEESQAVTIEFRKLGIEAYSCDVQECSGGHPEWHIQKDVLTILNDKWDCLIAFPPCTYLCNSGNRWLNENEYGHAAFERKIKRADAFRFFMNLWRSKIEHICIENPVGFMNTHFRKPDQIIQPWQFGHSEKKSTCLWLKNLPLLKPTDIIEERNESIWRMGPRKDRAKLRSKTFPGIAEAIAAQWGKFLLEL